VAVARDDPAAVPEAIQTPMVAGGASAAAVTEETAAGQEVVADACASFHLRKERPQDAVTRPLNRSEDPLHVCASYAYRGIQFPR